MFTNIYNTGYTADDIYDNTPFLILITNHTNLESYWENYILHKFHGFFMVDQAISERERKRTIYIYFILKSWRQTRAARTIWNNNFIC